MSVIIGSARGDEHGRASGGKAGDQKQSKTPDYSGEVSKQEWYQHSKGWVLIRFKDEKVREKIAQDMGYACDNPYVGYNQGKNKTLYEVSRPYRFDCSKVKTPCETDCAKLVRVCVLYAGVECDDFYTANEVEVLKKTGQCTVSRAKKYTESSDYLLRGDILVTPVKGHTVVVLSTGKKAGAPERTYGDAVREFQIFLNENYDRYFETLEVDGEYGPKTRAAAVDVFKYMANKYYGAHLTIGNSNFLTGCKTIAYLMTDEQIAKHPTLGWLVQGILAGRALYKGIMDGKLGEESVKAIMAFQREVGIDASGCVTGGTWYRLFN